MDINSDVEVWVDVLIIGGGPNALSLAARLHEPRPDAIYTETEHSRLAWLGGQRHGRIKRPNSLKSRSLKHHEESPLKVLAVDASGAEWLASWNNMFENLHIKHLRSPMFVHPSPADLDGLVAFAHSQGRTDELMEICGCVGKEHSKHRAKRARSKNPVRISQSSALINERDRRDYFTPSQKLFRDFIKQDVVGRYNLDDKIVHAQVIDIVYSNAVPLGSVAKSGFVVRMRKTDGSTQVIGARAVAVAVGSGGFPNIPRFLADNSADNSAHENWCHSGAFARKDLVFPSPKLQERILNGHQTSMLVIGGGLTAAQVAHLAILRGVSHVTMVVRNRFKSKPFDLDLEWVSKYQNRLKMAWHQEGDHFKRLDCFKAAKGGGSVTPNYYRICKDLCAQGRLTIHEQASVEAAEFHGGQWTLDIVCAGSNTRTFDYIVAATGNTVDVERLPFLQTIREQYVGRFLLICLMYSVELRTILPQPIKSINGFPLLDSDCKWPDIPLFMRGLDHPQVWCIANAQVIAVGGYSLLEIGPSAFNLASTRECSERVVHALGNLGIGVSKNSTPADAIVDGGLFDALSGLSESC